MFKISKNNTWLELSLLIFLAWFSLFEIKRFVE